MIDRLNAALEGRYSVGDKIGEGGMATVYLADDLRHERKVALKVLKPELAAVVGSDRFLGEIKTTANLQHPHILPLFDSGEADGLVFFVMPYVEGETLRDRLDREKQLPVDEAVSMASAVASALDYAHRHGVIHRDIKPGNIMLQDGQPVVGDFGIALAAGAASGARLTETGLSVGTPYYMSPEQATGDQEVGPSSDIYALGAVLFELLAGDPPYVGSTAQAVLGQIIQGKPVSVTEARRAVPANVESAIRKALEKLPADRFATAQGFAGALKDPGFRYGAEEQSVAAATKRSRWVVGATALAAALAGIAMGWGMAGGSAETMLVIRERIAPIGEGMARPVGTYAALAPDGSSMVYAMEVEEGRGWQLWIKPRGVADATPLSGTEMAQNAVYSPDSEWIAFVSEGELKKRNLRDGSVITLASGTGGGEVAVAWQDDGTILYEPAGGDPSLVRIPETGGGPVDTVATYEGYEQLAFAGPLPGSKGVLVTRCRAGCGADMELGILDLESGETVDLFEEVMRGWYVPTGHLIYVRPDGSVLAAPFDLDALEVTRAGTPLFEGVAAVVSSPQIAVGLDGTVLYMEGQADRWAGDVVWVDREGRVTPVADDLTDRAFLNIALSPDDRRIALSIGGMEGGQAAPPQLWVKELPDGPLTRLTTDPGFTRRPVWTEDGRNISYVTNETGLYEARIIPADGSTAGSFEVLLQRERAVYEVFFTPDESGVLFREGNANIGAADLGILNLETNEVEEGFLASDFNERAVSLSPDGKWMAYASNASGRDEVFVRPFPSKSGRTPISNAGGTNPVWAHNGSELFFIDAEGWMSVARFRADDEFVVESRTRLFDASPYRQWSPDWRRFDVESTDERFLMVRTVGGEDGLERNFVVIRNFFEEVLERVGG